MEKKTRRIIFAVIGVMLIITALIACIYIRQRDDVPDHSILLDINGKEQVIELDDLKTVPFSGKVVNGKGEEKNVSGDCVLISDIVGNDSFTEAVVISDDEYRATVKADEFKSARLIINDGEVRLIVPGDENAKRDVKNVVRIEVK